MYVMIQTEFKLNMLFIVKINNIIIFYTYIFIWNINYIIYNIFFIKNVNFKKKILTNNVLKIQQKYIKHIYVNDVVEKLYTKNDYNINTCKKILKNESLCIIGYEPQGKSQALNLKDNGFNIVYTQLFLKKAWNGYLKTVQPQRKGVR